MTKTLNGKWEGLMHDVEGLNARGTLELTEDERGGVKGRFVYELIGDHAPGKPIDGMAEGSRTKDGLIQLVAKLESLGAVRFEGRTMAVQHHAVAAIVGIYDVTGQRQEPVGGGTAIFWQFADKR